MGNNPFDLHADRANLLKLWQKIFLFAIILALVGGFVYLTNVTKQEPLPVLLEITPPPVQEGIGWME